MPLWALAALSDKGGEGGGGDLIDNALSSTLFALGAASIRCEDIFFPTEIIASVLLWMFFRASVRWIGPRDREPFTLKVVCILGN